MKKILPAFICILICVAIPRANADPSGSSARYREFDFITKKIESVYSHLNDKQERYKFQYDKIKKSYRNKIKDILSDVEYQAMLDSLMKEFHDGHLKIENAETTIHGSEPKQAAVTHRWEGGGILVTKISRLWGDEVRIKRDLNNGISLLRRARALMIDLRDNGGGNDALAFHYISRFIAKRIPLGKFSIRISDDVLKARPHYRSMYPPDPSRKGFSVWREFYVEPKTKRSFAGPIAVLIDEKCYSSCEGAALALKESGIAKLFGTHTGGGSGNPIEIELPETSGTLMIPTWIYVMPGGVPLEDNGVTPDVVITDPDEQENTALGYLRAGSASPL